MKQFYISAAHKSSGKTVVSIGIARALRRRGLRVATFKKGPDYIDPKWLHHASNRECWNLDFFTMGHEEIKTCFDLHRRNTDVTIIEGNKGLYDGLDVEGSDCNAALVSKLNIPVVLVIDVVGITRGIAPLLKGYVSFDPEVKIVGVILNRVASPRQEGKLRAAIERYTSLPVIGVIGRDPVLSIDERHLGLVPENEASEATVKIDQISDVIEKSVDLDQLLELTSAEIGPDPNPVLKSNSDDLTVRRLTARSLKIGIARDRAFGFYYPDDMAAFESAGAELVPFDTLSDQYLPDVDGIFIGGGFPECFIEDLAANKTMRSEIKMFIESGGPAYAECGGLMYLSCSISWRDQSGPMVGVIPAHTKVLNRPVGRGYMQLRIRSDHPWTATGENARSLIPAHEFHHSLLEPVDANWSTAFTVERGHGLDGSRDGIHIHNLLAGYAHQRHVQANPWVDAFVDFVHEHRK